MKDLERKKGDLETKVLYRLSKITFTITTLLIFEIVSKIMFVINFTSFDQNLIILAINLCEKKY